MARTTRKYSYTMNKEELKNKLNKILINKGFNLVNYNGESVYKKGVGFLTSTKYIKVDVYDDSVDISGWVRNFGISENDLEGFVGVIPKATVTKVIDQMASIIK